MRPATIDRYLLRRSLAGTLLILGVITALMLGIDTLMNLRWYLRGSLDPDTSRAWLIVQLLAMRLPELLGPLLPIATVGGALLAITPMLRRGELLALAASGISVRRAVRATFLLAVAIGVVDWVVSDQIAPRLETERAVLEDLLQGSYQHGAAWQAPATGTEWFAEYVKFDRAGGFTIRDVVAASPDGVLTSAGALAYRDGTWILEPPIVIGADGSPPRLERHDDALVCRGPLALATTPTALAGELLSRHARTSRELIARGGRLQLALAWRRALRLLLPLLCLSCAVPLFARFGNRDRLLVAAGTALLIALWPLAVAGVGAVAADTSPWPLPLVAAATLILAVAPGVVLRMRWRD